jgi:hypothetical protein
MCFVCTNAIVAGRSRQVEILLLRVLNWNTRPVDKGFDFLIWLVSSLYFEEVEFFGRLAKIEESAFSNLS